MKRLFLWIALIAAIALYKGYGMVTDRMKGPRWDRLTPETKQMALDVLADAEKEGLDVMFWSGWRNINDQKKNISQGTSFVADPLDSYHVWGLAFDIVFRTFAGLPSWPNPHDEGPNDPDMVRWKKLGEIGKRHGLGWGGDWRKFDGPHFQNTKHKPSQLKKLYSDNPIAFLKSQGVMA